MWSDDKKGYNAGGLTVNLATELFCQKIDRARNCQFLVHVSTAMQYANCFKPTPFLTDGSTLLLPTTRVYYIFS